MLLFVIVFHILAGSQTLKLHTDKAKDPPVIGAKIMDSFHSVQSGDVERIL